MSSLRVSGLVLVPRGLFSTLMKSRTFGIWRSARSPWLRSSDVVTTAYHGLHLIQARGSGIFEGFSCHNRPVGSGLRIRNSPSSQYSINGSELARRPSDDGSPSKVSRSALDTEGGGLVQLTWLKICVHRVVSPVLRGRETLRNVLSNRANRPRKHSSLVQCGT
jgi:hypothetical protein